MNRFERWLDKHFLYVMMCLIIAAGVAIAWGVREGNANRLIGVEQGCEYCIHLEGH